ncbi:MAG: hypothetical protein ACI4B5_05525, partial [Bacteroidaceae bacterium]
MDKSRNESLPSPPSPPAMRLSTLMSAEFNLPLMASEVHVSYWACVSRVPSVPAFFVMTFVIANVLVAHNSATSIMVGLMDVFIAFCFCFYAYSFPSFSPFPLYPYLELP